MSQSEGPLTKFSLEGVVAAVTGAGSGIGLAAARALAAAGAGVCYMDRVLDRSVIPDGDGHHSLQVDVTEEDQVLEAFATVRRILGPVGVLVCCAGLQMVADERPISQSSRRVWTDTFDVNVTGTVLAMKYAIPHMRELGGGSIITCGSPTGLSGRGWRYPAYAASKGAVSALTMASAAALAVDGIRCNCLVPGITRTPLVDSVLADREVEMTESIPLKRIADPDDYAGAIIYLASSASSYATGTTLVVDGGLLIG